MKSFVILFISLLLVTGCGALEPPEINTEGNTFSSSKNPSIQIELNEDFQYIGTIDNTFQAKTLGFTGQTIKTDSTHYLYAQLSSDNYLKKMIGISVLELPAGRSWNPNTMLVVKNPLKESIVKFGENNFQFCIKAKRAVNKLTGQYLLEKGISTPKCYLWMLIGRVFGNNVKMYISFYDDISNFGGFGIDSCKDWKDKETLNEKQKKYLEEFENRAHNSIKNLKN